MKAILLATGEDQRLTPLSAQLPSPLVPIANRPVIVYAIEALVRAGIKEISVAVHHLAGSIEAYCGDGRRWGAQLTYAVLPQPFGSAGALKWAANYLTETMIVMPADTLLDVDLTRAIEAHQASGALVTVVTRPPLGQPSHPIGVNANRQVTVAARDDDWSNATVLDNVGVYVIEPSALQLIPDRSRCDLADDWLPAVIAQQSNVYSHTMMGYWNQLTSFAEVQAAQLVVMHSARLAPPTLSKLPKIAHPYIEGKQMADGIWIGRNTIIHPAAKLAAPVILGDNCQIGRDVEVGPNAVIGANVVIDEEATITNSTIIDHTYVGRLVKIADRVVHHTQLMGFQGESTTVVDRFLLGETSFSLTGHAARRGGDVVLAGLLLILLAPLLILIGLWSMVRTGHPFRRESFVGVRMSGASTEPTVFTVLHFSAGRAWEFDRLLELFNILRGDLSFVGVKPLTLAEALHVTEDWQKQRFTRPAGFTGEWYVQPLSAGTLDEVLVADAYYAATCSTRGDLQLLLHTPAAWLSHRRRVAPREQRLPA